MPAGDISSQLATLLDRQGIISTDVAVIKERMNAVPKLEERVTKLEAWRVRWGAYWAAAVVFGAAIGYGLSYLPTHHH